MNKNKFTEIFCATLFLILLYSYLPTISETLSQSGSADFLWQSAKCTYDGINFYSSYLSQDGKCPFFLNDGAGYAQGFYIMLYPFTFFSWDEAKLIWLIVNIFLIISTLILLCNKFQLGYEETWLIIFIVMYSIITRVNLIMGQHTIFTLFFLSLPFVYSSKISALISGISFFKYNIGYVLFIFFLVSKEYKKVLFSILPTLFGLILFCYITNSNIFENIFQPIKLAFYNAQNHGATLNNIFLFSFIENFTILNNSSRYLLIGFLTLLFNFYFINKVNLKKNNLLKLSCLCLLVLISTPHWGHDYILLTPLLIYSIKYYSYNLSIHRMNIAVCIFFLYLYSGVQKYLSIFLTNLNFDTSLINLLFPYINILILLLTLFTNLFLSQDFNNREEKIN